MVGLLLAFAVGIVGTLLYGVNRWQSATKRLHTRIVAARLPIIPKFYDSRELEGVPAPVQRYFRAVLKEGQPFIAGVSVEHDGTFNLSKSGEQWQPFNSRQRVITKPPGFVWDGAIQMFSGLKVFVHDAYVAGQGVLVAKLLGLITVMEQARTPELAQGELMRFFAEAVWYPTALLPSQGVYWQGIDDRHASATFTDSGTTVKLLLAFDGQGLISSVRSEGRYREIDGVQVATPWQGRFWDYELQDGMLVPLAGEVAWLLAEGPKPYWRGRIKRIVYKYAQ